MKKVQIIVKWVLILVCCAFAGMSASDSSAALTPISPFQAEALTDPNPPAYLYSSSIAYYNNYLIYAGERRKDLWVQLGLQRVGCYQRHQFVKLGIYGSPRVLCQLR